MTPAAPTPATPTPATPTPVTPTPVTQTPATLTPATLTPVTPTPVTQTPATLTPATPTPVTQTPATLTPATRTPATLTPAPRKPATLTPATLTPATQTPATLTPATQTPATRTPGTLTPASSNKIAKYWTKEEAKLLVATRLEMQEEFDSGKKNHTVLWGRILDVFLSHGIDVTLEQLKNKFKEIKRQWRDAVDDNSITGNDPKSCPFFEEMSEVFGTKAGSRPAFTLSSLERDDHSQLEDPQPAKKNIREQRHQKKTLAQPFVQTGWKAMRVGKTASKRDTFKCYKRCMKIK